MDASDWDRRYAGAELVWSASANRFVVAELAALPPGHAVDVAAGEGRNALWLASRGWEVTAVDFSAVAVAKARALEERHSPGHAPRVRWVVADVTEHDLGSEVFDLGVIGYLQLPTPSRGEAVRRAFGSLRAGGTLLVVAHDSSNLIEGVGGPQDAAVLYTAEDVLADLDGERFDVVRAERVTRPVTDPDRPGQPPRPAYDCLVRVVRTG
jgi:SAM-dependent methyltransferase